MNINSKEQPIAWALIILGVLALLTGGGLLSGLSSAARALLLILGGVYLSRRYLRNPQEVWALAAALGLFGVALMAFSSATAILALLGLGFAALYWRNQTQWWAVLPAGLFLSLAVAVGLGGALLGTAPLLFLGFAATFGVLMRLGKRWAVYPAIIALVIALLSTSIVSSSLLPLLLIGGGLYLFANPGVFSSSKSSHSLQGEPKTPVEVDNTAERVDLEKSQATGNPKDYA